MIRRNYVFSDDFIEVLNRVKKDTNHTNETAVIIQAVTSLDRKNNPAYKDPLTNKNLSPEEKVNQAIKLDEAKKNKKYEKFYEIATALGAEIYDDEGTGEKRVTFYNYQENYRDQIDTTLDSLTLDLIKDQYIPSKEDVLRRRKEGKTKY